MQSAFHLSWHKSIGRIWQIKKAFHINVKSHKSIFGSIILSKCLEGNRVQLTDDLRDYQTWIWYGTVPRDCKHCVYFVWRRGLKGKGYCVKTWGTMASKKFGGKRLWCTKPLKMLHYTRAYFWPKILQLNVKPCFILAVVFIFIFHISNINPNTKIVLWFFKLVLFFKLPI